MEESRKSLEENERRTFQPILELLMDKLLPTDSQARCPICDDPKVVRFVFLGLAGISGICRCHRFTIHLEHSALAGIGALIMIVQAILLFAWANYELDVSNIHSDRFLHPARLLQVLGFAHLPIATAWLHIMCRVWHPRIGSLLAVVIATVVGVAMLNTPWETSFNFLLPHWGILKSEYVDPAVSLVGRLTCLFLLGAAAKNAKDGESFSDLYQEWYRDCFKKGYEKTGA
jgi:hypothetical protein